METKNLILAVLIVFAFFALCLLALKRFSGWLGRYMLDFWWHSGVIGAKDGSMDNARTNGFVLVGSVLFLLLGAFGLVAVGGLEYVPLKIIALAFVVAFFAPLVAKYFGGRKRK